MEELKGEEITHIFPHYEGLVILTGTKKNWSRYHLSYDTLKKILKDDFFLVKKKRVRTHIIDVIR